MHGKIKPRQGLTINRHHRTRSNLISCPWCRRHWREGVFWLVYLFYSLGAASTVCVSGVFNLSSSVYYWKYVAVRVSFSKCWTHPFRFSYHYDKVICPYFLTFLFWFVCLQICCSFLVYSHCTNSVDSSTYKGDYLGTVVLVTESRCCFCDWCSSWTQKFCVGECKKSHLNQASTRHFM